MYDGFFNTPASMPLLSNARTRSISAENPTGEKGAGALATTGTGEKSARNLGKGWKVSPSVSIPAGKIEMFDGDWLDEMAGEIAAL